MGKSVSLKLANQLTEQLNNAVKTAKIDTPKLDYLNTFFDEVKEFLTDINRNLNQPFFTTQEFKEQDAWGNNVYALEVLMQEDKPNNFNSAIKVAVTDCSNPTAHRRPFSVKITYEETLYGINAHELVNNKTLLKIISKSLFKSMAYKDIENALKQAPAPAQP